MTKFMDDLDESLVNDFIKQGSWGKCGVAVSLKEDKTEEKVEEKVEEPKTDKAEETSIQEHVCPLCESKLKEALDDDLITERVQVISEAILEVIKESETEEADSESSTEQ